MGNVGSIVNCTRDYKTGYLCAWCFDCDHCPGLFFLFPLPFSFSMINNQQFYIMSHGWKRQNSTNMNKNSHLIQENRLIRTEKSELSLLHKVCFCISVFFSHAQAALSVFVLEQPQHTGDLVLLRLTGFLIMWRKQFPWNPRKTRRALKCFTQRGIRSKRSKSKAEFRQKKEVQGPRKQTRKLECFCWCGTKGQTWGQRAGVGYTGGLIVGLGAGGCGSQVVKRGGKTLLQDIDRKDGWLWRSKKRSSSRVIILMTPPINSRLTSCREAPHAACFTVIKRGAATLISSENTRTVVIQHEPATCEIL